MSIHDMPLELRKWIKDQLRAMERNELEDWKKVKMLDFLEYSIKEHKAEIYAILLKEVLEEEEEPICKTHLCNNKASRKVLDSGEHSEMWGLTDKYNSHKYHWNLCDDCFRKETEDDEDD
jgi:hypothetical protein